MSVADKTLVEVQNLTDHTVVYKSFDGIRRVFLGQQKKKIRAEELRQLNYSRGGSRLLKEFLSVKNKALAEEFNVSSDSFEHEYNWTAQDVDDMLLSGSEDALKDALDFAPEGIIDLIVQRTVELKLNDVNKRQIISDKTGKDVNNMILQITEFEKANKTSGESSKQQKARRVSTEEKNTSSRRCAQKQSLKGGYKNETKKMRYQRNLL